MENHRMIYLLNSIDGRQTAYINLEAYETTIREVYGDLVTKLNDIGHRGLRVPPYHRFRSYIVSIVVSRILKHYSHLICDSTLLARVDYYAELPLPLKIVDIMLTELHPDIDYSVEPQSNGWPVGLISNESPNVLVQLVRSFLEECAYLNLIELKWTSL